MAALHVNLKNECTPPNTRTLRETIRTYFLHFVPIDWQVTVVFYLFVNLPFQCLQFLFFVSRIFELLSENTQITYLK